MRLLYLSVHEILEHDELKMFTQLGIDCYSLGAYTYPYGDQGRKRPGIPEMPYDPHFIELSTRYSKDDLHPEMIEPADVIIVMHEPSFLLKNWPKIRHKRVIWRTIGQSIANTERILGDLRRDGLEIVRYSPKEKNISGYLGSDALIRFQADPDVYHSWYGVDPSAVNFTQSIAQRGSHCGWPLVQSIARDVPFKLYGPGNDGISFYQGMVSHEEQIAVLQRSRAYFYTGTHPASYTLGFIEAFMTGTPIVAVGHKLGSPHASGYPQDTYEVHELLDGVGFVSDNPNQLKGHLKDLINDYALAQHTSQISRERALEFFDISKIRNQWKEFLGV